MISFPQKLLLVEKRRMGKLGFWLNEAIKQGLGISLLKTALPSLYLLIFLLPPKIRSQTYQIALLCLLYLSVEINKYQKYKSVELGDLRIRDNSK